MNRDEIFEAIKNKRQEMDTLKTEIQELNIKNLQLSDDKYQYKEKVEMVWVNDKRKKKVECLVGRVYWVENFKDETTGGIVPIERSCPVKFDDEWRVPNHMLY